MKTAYMGIYPDEFDSRKELKTYLVKSYVGKLQSYNLESHFEVVLPEDEVYEAERQEFFAYDDLEGDHNPRFTSGFELLTNPDELDRFDVMGGEFWIVRFEVTNHTEYREAHRSMRDLYERMGATGYYFTRGDEISLSRYKEEYLKLVLNDYDHRTTLRAIIEVGREKALTDINKFLIYYPHMMGSTDIVGIGVTDSSEHYGFRIDRPGGETIEIEMVEEIGDYECIEVDKSDIPIYEMLR